MIKEKPILLILLVALLGIAWSMHDFYVSLTEIRYNPETERLEVSMRIFPDDLDRALFEASGINTNLATEIEHRDADSILAVYLRQNISIRLNGQTATLAFLGKETEGNAIWCYMESQVLPPPGTFVVEMDLLTGTFPDQVNIVQIYMEEWNRGLLLNRENRKGSAEVVYH